MRKAFEIIERYKLRFIATILPGIVWFLSAETLLSVFISDAHIISNVKEALNYACITGMAAVAVCTVYSYFEDEKHDAGRYAVYFKKSKSGILVFNEEGIMLEANGEAKALLGYSDGTFPDGMHFDRVFRSYFDEHDHELGIIIKRSPSFIDITRRREQTFDTSIISGEEKRIYLRLSTSIAFADEANSEDPIIIVSVEDILEKINMDRSILSLNRILEKRVTERTQELHKMIRELEEKKNEIEYPDVYLKKNIN